MITATINNNRFEINTKENTVNGKALNPDWICIAPDKYHAIINNQSLVVELLEVVEPNKQITVLVNGEKYEVSIENEYDALLKTLGLDKLNTSKVNQLKAPMPGMVLKINVSEGQAVKKGDSLLLLEAMKMENVIKAAGDAVVKKILITEKNTVDKGQVIMEFE